MQGDDLIHIAVCLISFLAFAKARIMQQISNNEAAQGREEERGNE